jgi:hypothetical protein
MHTALQLEWRDLLLIDNFMQLEDAVKETNITGDLVNQIIDYVVPARVAVMARGVNKTALGIKAPVARTLSFPPTADANERERRTVEDSKERAEREVEEANPDRGCAGSSGDQVTVLPERCPKCGETPLPGRTIEEHKATCKVGDDNDDAPGDRAD